MDTEIIWRDPDRPKSSLKEEKAVSTYRVVEKTPSGNTLCHSTQCFSEAELSNISVLDQGVGRSIFPGDGAE